MPLLLKDSQEYQNLIVYPRRERKSVKKNLTGLEKMLSGYFAILR